MKTRTGFVSNSSSSSFIIGYAVVKNRDKLLQYLDDNKIDKSYKDIMIHRPEDKTDDWFSMEFGWVDEVQLVPPYDEDLMCDEIYRKVHAGNNIFITIPEKILDKELIIAQILNDEGDGEFYYDNDYDSEVGLNYKKAERKEFFNSKQQKIIDLFTNEELVDVRYSVVQIGAERNG